MIVCTYKKVVQERASNTFVCRFLLSIICSHPISLNFSPSFNFHSHFLFVGFFHLKSAFIFSCENDVYLKKNCWKCTIQTILLELHARKRGFHTNETLHEIREKTMNDSNLHCNIAQLMTIRRYLICE